jgi:hypothetical protein
MTGNSKRRYEKGVWNLPISESKAFFATDMQKLMEAFATIFQTIQDVSATGSAPLVNLQKTPVVLEAIFNRL